MAIKYEELQQLMNEFIADTMSGTKEWKDFLQAGSKLYKFSFGNQLAIYAQNTEASLCAGFELWKKLGRYVKGGRKGIRIYEKCNFSTGNYVFDITDTEPIKDRKQITAWQGNVTEDNLKLLLLEYDLEHSDDITGAAAVKLVSDSIINELFEMYMEKSPAGEAECQQLRKLAAESIEYTILYKCNMLTEEADRRISFDFKNVSEILSDMQEFVSFGEIAADASRQIFSDLIKINKKALEKNKNLEYNTEKNISSKEKITRRQENGNRYTLQRGKRLSGTGHRISAAAGGRDRLLWQKKKGIPEGTRQENVSLSPVEYGNESASSGDTGAGRAQNGNPYKADERRTGSDRGTQGQRSDGLGIENDSNQGGSSGDSSQRDNIRIVTEDEEYRETEGSTSVFSYSEKEMSALIGRQLTIDDREFVIDQIADNKVTLQDITFKNSVGFPIFRVEDVETVLNLIREETQKKSEKADYHITDQQPKAGSAREKLEKNILAIEVLKQIEREKRAADPAEQEALASYVGWGGLSDTFDEEKQLYSSRLKRILTDSEYESAKGSVLNAHYTSPEIIDCMYDVISDMGFETGNILEPAMGTGNFFGRIPESMSDAKLYGVEIDSISGRIAKLLYPSAKIDIKGYEKTQYPDNSFDVAIGNVPFGSYSLFDRRYNRYGFKIHDYFFAKTLDQVRPGGLIAFITSKGTMDKKTSSVRRYIAQRAELLGAIRLPNTAFKANAGTEVTSDIIFLQKRDALVTEPNDEWINLATDENGYTYNSYFVSHPEMIAGEMKEVSGPFGPELTCMPKALLPLGEEIREAAANIKGVYTAGVTYAFDEEAETEADVITAEPEVPNFSFTIKDDKVYYRENSLMYHRDVNATALQRIKGMIEVRDVVRDLISAQVDGATDETVKGLQAELDRVYTEFTKKYGIISSRANELAFKDDASYPLISSLEVTDSDRNLLGKADIFTKRTIRPHKAVSSVNTASEALAVSLSEKGYVDMEYMSALYGKTEDEIFKALKGVIFKLPDVSGRNVSYVTADEYLSGNIRRKLITARFCAEQNSEFKENAAALEKAMPKPLEAGEIDVRLGATWIDEGIYRQFIFELLETPGYLKYHIKVEYAKPLSSWSIAGKSADSMNVLARSTYGTERASAYRIIEDSLNLRPVTITDIVTDENGREKRFINNEQTLLAREKQDLIKEKFKSWIWQDPQRRAELTEKYNVLFNSTVPREYNGDHLEFPGMNPEINLEPHQKRAVARQIYGGNTLLFHPVGAGKTFEIATAIMEKKRLGLCSKALIAVPNHLVGQWAKEFMVLYPSANILAITAKEFTPMARKKFCSRIATGDYDAVIIGHSQFEKIPMSEEYHKAFLDRQLEDLTNAIIEEKEKEGKRLTVKQLETEKKKIEKKIQEMGEGNPKDNTICFEQLGVDFLCVDEAHNYKNLETQTKMSNIAGINTGGANKSSDMFEKVRYLDELTGGKGVTFATGTPISNSMVEMYTMQKYLQYDRLEELGLLNFDAWASTYGEIKTAFELAPEGTGYRQKTRFANFFNIPELMSVFKEAADIISADDLNIKRPEPVYETVVLKASPKQELMVQSFAERAEKVRNHMVDPAVDNMLKITNDGRKIALDERLIEGVDNIPEEVFSMGKSTAENKASACVEKAMQHYYESMEIKGTQLIFCDIATPNKDGRFSIYDDIREQLIDMGVPAEEIEFIHNCNTDKKKLELYSSVRAGKVRFLLGSSSKMGAGMNVQDRLVAAHHLDVPWRPLDIEQREGRIIRRGNMNEEVHIYKYVTEGTFDAYSWQIIENKQKFASQITSGNPSVRSCEDIDEATLSYAEIKALCTGNPYIKEKMQLETEVARLKLVKSNYISEHYRLEDELYKRLPLQLKKCKEEIEQLKEDVKTIEENSISEDDFSIVLKGRTFDKKKEAGEEIIDAALNGVDGVIGSYRGFDLKVKKEFNELTGLSFSLYICGHGNYSTELGKDPVGAVMRLNNLIGKLPEKLSAKIEFEQTLENRIKNTETQLKKPFEREAELQEKTARLNELNILLEPAPEIGQPDQEYDEEEFEP